MSSFQFQILSDLHLETPLARPSYEHFQIEPRAPFLALLGDIGYVTDSRLFNFLKSQLQQFEVVFYLLGNHEAYGTTFSDARMRMEAFCEEMEISRATVARMGRFIYLDRTRYDVSNRLTILGCTLFSQITPDQTDAVRLFVSDFSNIENWSIEDHCSAHQLDLQWLNKEVANMAREEPFRSIIIFTHHSPTKLAQANDERYLNNDNRGVNSAFITDLSECICWVSQQVKLWAFGHTHFNCDFEDPQSDKRVLANQKGYRRAERLSFDGTKVVDISDNPKAPAPENKGEASAQDKIELGQR